MAKRMTNSRLGPLCTLFCLGRVGDRTDGELLQWFETRHAEAETAFEELVARHGAMVLDVCRQVLRDSHDVDDAFQATFLILLRRSGSIRNRETFGGWLHRVALRVALRVRTESVHRRETETLLAKSSTSDSTLHDVERDEIRMAVHEELDRIPTSYRTALVACYLEGLTHEEAANRLHWPVGTVRSRLARGRDQLRHRLARRGLAPGFVLPATGHAAPPVPTLLQRSAEELVFSYFNGHAHAVKLSTRAAVLAERMIRAMKLRSITVFASVALVAGTAAGVLPFLTVEEASLARATTGETQAVDLNPAKSLAGLVRDSEGNPVAGATVIAGRFTAELNHMITTSGPDGRFAFPPGRGEKKLEYAVAYKEGLAPASKFGSGIADGTPSGEMELILLKVEPFVGVVENRDGSPIAGASVWIKYMKGRGGKYDNPILENVLRGTALESLFNTTTDKQGHFRFRAVPAPQGIALHVSADGMGDLSTKGPGKFEAGYVEGTVAVPARLTMQPEARVRGRVVTRLPGMTLAGLKVGLQSTNDSRQIWRESRTDAEGRFEMRGLPAGKCNIFLYNQPSDGAWAYRAIDSLPLHPGETAEATLELIEGLLVEGQVVDADSGNPIAGTSVAMYGPARPHSGAAVLSAKTDEKGRYHFRLPPGATRFYLYSADQVAPIQDVLIPGSSKIFTVPTLEARKRSRTTSAAGRAK
jgi:RNA polymerase sigma factor (sigma-70 family)